MLVHFSANVTRVRNSEFTIESSSIRIRQLTEEPISNKVFDLKRYTIPWKDYSLHLETHQPFPRDSNLTFFVTISFLVRTELTCDWEIKVLSNTYHVGSSKSSQFSKRFSSSS